MLPLTISSVLIKLIGLFGLKKSLLSFMVHSIIVLLAFVWSMFGTWYMDGIYCLIWFIILNTRNFVI